MKISRKYFFKFIFALLTFDIFEMLVSYLINFYVFCKIQKKIDEKKGN